MVLIMRTCYAHLLRALAIRTCYAHSQCAPAMYTCFVRLLCALAMRTYYVHLLCALATRTRYAHLLCALAIHSFFRLCITPGIDFVMRVCITPGLGSECSTRVRIRLLQLLGHPRKRRWAHKDERAGAMEVFGIGQSRVQGHSKHA
eukprot:1159088-Pelagomonas_calceolata.AAC.4